MFLKPALHTPTSTATAIFEWADKPIRLSDFIRTIGRAELPRQLSSGEMESFVVRTAWIQRHALLGVCPEMFGEPRTEFWAQRHLPSLFEAACKELTGWDFRDGPTRVLGLKGRWWFRADATPVEKCMGFRVVEDPFDGLI